MHKENKKLSPMVFIIIGIILSSRCEHIRIHTVIFMKKIRNHTTVLKKLCIFYSRINGYENSLFHFKSP